MKRIATGWCGRWVRLIDEPTLAGRLGRAARQRVQAHFSLEASLARLWGILSDAMGQAPSAAGVHRMNGG